MTQQEKNYSEQKQQGGEMSEQDFKKILKELVDKDVEKNSKPLWLTRQFVERPCAVISIGSLIFVILIFITVVTNAFAMAEPNNREYLIWSNERVRVYDMQVQMEDEFQKGQGGVQIPERSQDEQLWSTNVILECKDCNAFTKEGLKALLEFETKILTHKDYKNFCLASVDSAECSTDSVISLNQLAQRVLNKNPQDLTDQDVEALGDYIFSDESIWVVTKLMFGQDFSKENRKTEHIRTYMRFGTPIKVDGKLKKDKFDDKTEQKQEFNEFCLDIIDFRDDQKGLPKGMTILTFSLRMDNLEFQKTVDSDFMWAFASVFFVFVYISIHLESLFLGSTAMIQILVSFPVTQVIFKLILGISYFSSLHIMAIFIVLGIAADDVFVFMDCWRQTELYKQLDKDPQTRLNQRMAITFRRSSRAMLATSSTTSAAFLATGFSTIMPVSSFGFFAGILIPINFLLVILFFPSILVISETKFSQFKICCIKRSQQKQQQGQGQDEENNQQQEQSQDVDDESLPKVEKFFALKFSPFVNKYKYIIVVLFAIWIGIATWQALLISPISEPEKFLPEDHKSEQAKQKALYEFHQSANTDTGIVLQQFWGVKDIDNDDTSMWDPEDLGHIVWDKNFDLSPEANQQFFLDYCTELRDNELVQDRQVESFIHDFKIYAETSSSARQFPVPQSQFFQVLKDYTKTVSGIYYYNLNRIGIINDELRYVQIKIAAKGTAFRPYDELNPLYEKWEDQIDKANESAPEGMRGSKQTGGFHWTWMITERAFVTNAIQGMLISLSFGLVVLLASTHNIIMALFSLLSIIGIVVSVVSIMQFSGWELGIAESMTIVILIGLSIDYVVHLANHYVESVYPDRHRKIKVSLRDLGISIVSGALTTAGAGFFLLFGTVIIFNKFAILILSTIFFSLMFSLLFFSALMHAFGPENDFGSLLKCCPNRKAQFNQISETNLDSKKKQQQQKQQQNSNENNNNEIVPGTPQQQTIDRNVVQMEKDQEQQQQQEHSYVDQQAANEEKEVDINNYQQEVKPTSKDFTN